MHDVIAGFLRSRVGDDDWLLHDLLVYLETEHAALWRRCRLRLGEQDENGWLAALLDRLAAVEAEVRFRL